jgi:ribosome-associated toxin RatA of RatAB toxin-antitoxin module
MVDVTVSGVVQASPDDVFAFLADLANWPKWQSDMKSTTLAEGQPGQVGATYRYLSKAMGPTFDSTVRLVRVDAPRGGRLRGRMDRDNPTERPLPGRTGSRR